MDSHERVLQHFHESIRTLQMSMDQLAPSIVRAAESMAACLQEEGKILACGNGGSAADAQHFSAALLNRFDMERPGLPAMALGPDTATLTSIAEDASFREIYAKQVRALGQGHDVLLAISAGGHASSVNAAVEAAHERDMRVVALTGKDGGELATLLRPDDVEIRAPAPVNARIREVHLLVVHCLCDLIDQYLFNPE